MFEFLIGSKRLQQVRDWQQYEPRFSVPRNLLCPSGLVLCRGNVEIKFDPAIEFKGASRVWWSYFRRASRLQWIACGESIQPKRASAEL